MRPQQAREAGQQAQRPQRPPPASQCTRESARTRTTQPERRRRAKSNAGGARGRERARKTDEGVPGRSRRASVGRLPPTLHHRSESGRRAVRRVAAGPFRRKTTHRPARRRPGPESPRFRTYIRRRATGGSGRALMSAARNASPAEHALRAPGARASSVSFLAPRKPPVATPRSSPRPGDPSRPAWMVGRRGRFTCCSCSSSKSRTSSSANSLSAMTSDRTRTSQPKRPSLPASLSLDQRARSG